MTAKETHAINLGDLTIDLTITQTDNGAVELTDSNGNTKYLVDGTPVADTDSRYTGEFQKYGTFTVTISEAQMTAWNALSSDARKAAGGANDASNSDGYVDYTFHLSGQGNVVLLGSTTATDVADGDELKVVVRVTNLGAINVQSVGCQYFAIRANNADGAEYVESDFTTAFSAPANSGDKVYQDINNVRHYYVLTGNIIVADTIKTSGNDKNANEIFLHSADKIHIE